MRYFIVRRTDTENLTYFVYLIVDFTAIQQFDSIVFVGASHPECEVYASQNSIPIKALI